MNQNSVVFAKTQGGYISGQNNFLFWQQDMRGQPRHHENVCICRHRCRKPYLALSIGNKPYSIEIELN